MTQLSRAHDPAPFHRRPRRLAPFLACSIALVGAGCSGDDDDGGGGSGLPSESFSSVIGSAQSVPVPVAGTGVRVTVRNAAPEGGTFQTPVWVGFHDGTFDLYDSGSAASLFFPGSLALERLAEDGNNAPLVTDFDAAASGGAQGNLLGALGPAPGPIAPGETVSAEFRLDPTAMTSRYLSYGSMVIPSNDAFIASGDPMAHEIFDGAGNFVGTGFTVAGADVLDAGTEVNDETPANTAFFGQATPDTGADEGGVVGAHPGFMAAGMGGILDDPMFANADFTAMGYEALEVSVEEVTGLGLGGGVATYTLDPNSGALTVAVQISGLSGPATMLHLHEGAAGVTGPVLVDLFGLIEENTDGNLVAAGSVTLTAAQIASLRAGEVYLNCHTALNPAGEVRGQVGQGDGLTATLNTTQEIPSPVLGANVRITMRNRAPADGTFQTPVWFGLHDGTFDIHDTGSPASTFFPTTNALERIAEDGTTADLVSAFDTSSAGTVQGTLATAMGPIGPGALVSDMVRVDPGATTSQYFSYASMVIPSNDAFIANGDPMAHQVFSGGALGALDFTVTGAEVLDAGTEMNDEVPANTAFFGQMAPDTGTTTADNVELHPGFMAAGMGGILDDPMFAGADFTAMGYETLAVSVSEGPAPVAATGRALLSLNGAQDQLTYDLVVKDLSGPATMLHLHMGAAGSTGPVEIDLFGGVSVNEGGDLVASGTVAVTPAFVDLLTQGMVYFNLHTDLNPAGEVRGQVLMTGAN